MLLVDVRLNFLKAIEVRESARSTLVSVMELLGPRFISFVIKELSAVLTKGYQVNEMDAIHPSEVFHDYYFNC